MERDLWWNLNEVETKIMQAEGIISAVMNDMDTPESEKQMCALWGAETLLNKAREFLEAGFTAERTKNDPRPPIYNPLPEEYDEDGNDSLFAGTSLFGRKTTTTSTSSGDCKGCEGCEDPGERRTNETDREPAGRFDVELTEEHADGSATFKINATPEQMNKLFETMFVNAISRGLEATKAETTGILDEIKQARVILVAKKLEEKLRKWETTDDYDYDPDVLATRMDLTDAINQYNKED